MSTRPDFRSLTGDFRSIEELRQTYRPGCQPHYIQVLNSGREGRYEPGVLLGVDGMVAELRLDGTSRIWRIGTLWPDRLARVAMGNVDRDTQGRPWVQWNRRARVLQLRDAEDGAYPCFSVVDLDAHPEYLEAWEQLPATREVSRRPCLECGETFDWDDMDQVEQHLHETGLPGRLYRAARARNASHGVSGPGATSRSSDSDTDEPTRPDDGRFAPGFEPRDG